MWSVVVCEPGRVNDCSELLKKHGHTTFLPLIREHKRTLDKQKIWRVTSYDRPLFGPYLFVEPAFDVNWLEMRYVVKILNSTVPDPVIHALQASADPSGVIVGRHLPQVTNGRCIDFVAKRYDVCNIMLSTEVRGIIEDVSKLEKTGFVTVLISMLGQECKTQLHYTKIGNVIGRLPPSGLNRRERWKQAQQLA